MASFSDDDDELYYLSPDFDPNSLTVPRIRAILVQHDIAYTASAKKPQLIETFNEKLLPQARKLLAARARTRRTSKGITDMPSSQEGTINGDLEDDRSSMPPPPARTPGRKSKKSVLPPTDESAEEAAVVPAAKKTPAKRKSTKHPRTSDTEAGHDTEGLLQPVTQRSRKSDTLPTVKVEEDQERAVRPLLGESVFSDDNPFQSGSSPIAGEESRRRSSGIKKEKRKSQSQRRRTDEHEHVKQENGVVVPSSSTFEMPSSRTSRSARIKAEPEDALAPSEEFTPEEEQALIQEGAARGEVDVLRPARRRQKATGAFPKSAPWVVLMTLLAGYGAWYRKEKIEVGYCGIGKPITAMQQYEAPEWATVLQPQCETCPPHARCYSDMSVSCDPDFVLQPHPLSLGGLVPIPPTCEPDGEKVRKVKAVADKAVEELRERRAKWECGELVEEDGTPALSVEIDEPVLKAEVSQKRRRGMTDTEFEDLWRGALGEIIARDEVTSQTSGYVPPFRTRSSSACTDTQHSIHSPSFPCSFFHQRSLYISSDRLTKIRPHVHRSPILRSQQRLSSSSLARLPIGCAVRRSVRITLARYRIEAAGLLSILLAFFYVRSRILTERSDAARVPALIATTLDRLSTQAALHAHGARPEPWISVGQMRDDVLRDEFSAARRESIWKRVKAVVEMNANVRASVREDRLGEVSRVWEWIGSVPALEDQPWSGEKRRSGGGRQSLLYGDADANGSSSRSITPGRDDVSPSAGAGGRSGGGVGDTRKWDEGRPIY